MAKLLKKGDMVTFKGFEEGADAPKNGELLEVGVDYKISATKKTEDDETVYSVTAKNSKGKDVSVEVFPEEVKAAKAKTKAKAPAKQTAAAKKKADAKKKAADEAAKKAEEQEESEEDDVVTYADLEKGMEVALIAHDAGAEDDPIAEGVVKKVTTKQVTLEGEYGGVVKKADIGLIEMLVAEEESDEAEEAGEEEAGEEESGEEGRSTTRNEEHDPDLKGMIVLDEAQEDQELVALFNEAEDILELVQEIASDSIHTDWKLGAALYHIRLGKQYQDIDDLYKGAGGFREFCWNELKLDYRKAMDLLAVYTQFCKHGLGPEDLGQMGYSKAVLIQREFDDTDVAGLVDAAINQPVTELKETIRATRATTTNSGEPTTVINMHRFAFALAGTAGRSVKAAVEAGMEMTGLDIGPFFEQVMNDWGEQNLDIKVVQRNKRRLAKEEKEAGAE